MLAALSHFSITLIAVIGLIPLLYYSPLLTKGKARKTIVYLIGGLLTGRGLFALWYWKFDYLHTTGRADYVIDLGLNFFISRYAQSPTQFWLTAQIACLVPYLLTTLYFAYLKKYHFCIAALFSLALAYTALFFTVDGYRIFATVIAGTYCYLLLCLVNQLPLRSTRPPKTSL